MEATERLERDEELEETVSEISNDKTSLLTVVKALGPYLTSEEDEPRTKGVDFLSSVIARLPPAKLNIASVKVLTSFYCGKLDDTETVIPALKGLVILTALPSFTSEEATTVIRAFFEYVKMKSLVQGVRFHVFTIIDTLMAAHRETLKSMNKEFLDGYIFLAEGEKDPRNLLTAFAIARVILIEFDITRHVESLFNITFCYFPITFRPPPNDPYNISTDQLRMALRECMNATPSFGALAIPLLLDKLLAGSPVTKRDTLQSIASCLPVYGPAVARSFARKLWSSIKLEIFQPTDSTTEQEALMTMQELIKTIYSPEESSLESDDDIQGLAREACSECIQILKEPEKSQAKPAIKVLCAFIATTPSVTRFTISQAVPHLVKLFMNPDEVLTRPATMLLLSDLITAARDSSGQTLSPYKEDVYTITMMALGTFRSLNGLVTTKALLSDDELGTIVNNINDLLQVGTDGGDDTSDETVDLLTTIAMIAPHHIAERTLPLLFSALPDTAPARDVVTERAKCWLILAILSKLCAQANLFETLVSRLTTKLDILCVPKGQVDAQDLEPTSAYAQAILTTISRTLASKAEKGHTDVAKYVNRLVPQLFNLFVYSSILSDSQHMAATDYRVVSTAAEVIAAIIQPLTLQRQEVLAKSLTDALFHGNLQGLAEGFQKLPSNKNLDVFKGDTDAKKNIIALVAAVIIPLHSEVMVPVPDLNLFLHEIYMWSLDSASNDLQRDSAWHILSIIVNKRTEDASTFLDDALKSIWPTQVLSGNEPAVRRNAALKAFAWVTKGLLVKGHPLSMRFRDALFEAVKDEVIGWTAAKAIGEVVAVDSVLTKKNHANVKFLYAQKYVSQVLPRIVANARDSDDNKSQAAHLVALTALIRSVSRTAYAHAMPKLMPLLLRGLDLPDADIRASVIDSLFDAARSGETLEQSIISEHATSLVNAMLRNCMVDQTPSVRIRISALRFLAALPGVVRYDILHPSKNMSLDDPKRTVRKEAVQAR
ncbi:Dos2-interacting transcription regulator of RNA-Pol-II-domain-containing protein [Amanita rubescens]|nr:Dos2-interacting transcription regulator of RNA-Pol-II-domain-containing protein [Amanita rubescens]